MAQVRDIPVLGQFTREGLRYGANYLVEYDPHSIWYETSLTIAAHALRHSIRTDYHTFMHIPEEIEESLRKLGLDVESLQRGDVFRVLDNYTATTGLDPGKTRKGQDHLWLRSLDLKDWAASTVSEMKQEVPETEKRRLHLDDNTSVLVQYNDEKSFIDHWRTHEVPYARKFEHVTIHAVVRGVYSDAFYRQFESLCDGIVDLRSEEGNDGEISHYFRWRSIRGESADTRWRRLRFLANGEITADEAPVKLKELGIRKWLKGAGG